ncbi:PilZ domain-containing protein [Methylophaga pinxianii]|uniref:PilZ domain-containing protein n=1 Tax=Methylophaga pinxianii TaxID=2881052 RepID=UPI001CF4E888|nr:PilZ domain-containing protein [Methylophaga pinxianii]MCB2427647.1 PilZ domain-containing protein [Methylophaga pinxianii]UPH46636.1 PilZ domain-containing protein [Methylophaga pinxianii]
MNDTTLTGSDRRAFFRINDRLVMSFVPLTGVEAEQIGNAIIDATPEAGQLTQQMSSIQKSFNHLVDQIGHSDRDIARALRMLDEKVNLLAQNVQLLHTPLNPESAIEVNLSAGGLAFMTDIAFAARSPMEIRMQLLPGGLHIRAIAKVIACDQLIESIQGKSFYLRMAFTHMSDIDRNILVKHTLNRQAEELRNSKQI